MKKVISIPVLVSAKLRISSYLEVLVLYLRGIIDNNKYKGGIYMVFEYMDHDLTGLADRPGLRFTVPQIKVLHGYIAC